MLHFMPTKRMKSKKDQGSKKDSAKNQQHQTPNKFFLKEVELKMPFGEVRWGDIYSLLKHLTCELYSIKKATFIQQQQQQKKKFI